MFINKETTTDKHMLIQTLQSLFNRDLNRLKKEIELYQSEEVIWKVEQYIANSAGNLCLHLVGNLKTFIGAVLGESGYIRNRELEFSAKDVPKAELIKGVEEAIEIVSQTLEKLTETQIKNEYPVLVFETRASTEYMLIHLATHLGYHLGQVNYHRRLLDR